MKGFKLDFSGNQDFHKVYFSVKCQCGTAALISVEVSASKTQPEVLGAMPSLVDHVQTKANQFSAMPCRVHQQMRTGMVSE